MEGQSLGVGERRPSCGTVHNLLRIVWLLSVACGLRLLEPGLLRRLETRLLRLLESTLLWLLSKPCWLHAHLLRRTTIMLHLRRLPKTALRLERHTCRLRLQSWVILLHSLETRLLGWLETSIARRHWLLYPHLRLHRLLVSSKLWLQRRRTEPSARLLSVEAWCGCCPGRGCNAK